MKLTTKSYLLPASLLFALIFTGCDKNDPTAYDREIWKGGFSPAKEIGENGHEKNENVTDQNEASIAVVLSTVKVDSARSASPDSLHDELYYFSYMK